MNKNLTIENVNRELLRLMNENPDFKYSDEDNYPNQDGECSYVRGMKNGVECDGCIFGQALQTLGLTKEDLDLVEDIGDVWMRITDNKAPHYWQKIQILQDRGEAWGHLKYLIPSSRFSFEKWVSSLPHEYGLERLPDEDGLMGKYKDARVELACEAWSKAITLV